MTPREHEQNSSCAQPNQTSGKRRSGCLVKTSTNAIRWSGNAFARGKGVLSRGGSGLMKRLGYIDSREATVKLTVVRVENLFVEGYIVVKVNTASTAPALNDPKRGMSTFVGATVCTKLALRKRGLTFGRRSVVISVVAADGSRRVLGITRIDAAQYILVPGGNGTPVRITLPSGVVVVGTLSCSVDGDNEDDNVTPHVKRCATFSAPRQFSGVYSFAPDRPTPPSPRRYSFGGPINRSVLPWCSVNRPPVPRPSLTTALREHRLPSTSSLSSTATSSREEISHEQLNKQSLSEHRAGYRFQKDDVAQGSLPIQEHPESTGMYNTKNASCQNKGTVGLKLEDHRARSNKSSLEGSSDSDKMLSDDDSDSCIIDNDVSVSNSVRQNLQNDLVDSVDLGSKVNFGHRDKFANLERENHRLNAAIAVIDYSRVNQMVLVRENAWLKRQVDLLRIAVRREPTMKEVITELRWTKEALRRTAIQHKYLTKRVGLGSSDECNDIKGESVQVEL